MLHILSKHKSLVKELCISTMEWCMPCFLWFSTKDSHLFKLNACVGTIIAFCLIMHTHMVTHILHHNVAMVNLNNICKALIFVSGSNNSAALKNAGDDAGMPFLLCIQPCIVHVTEHQDFVVLPGRCP